MGLSRFLSVKLVPIGATNHGLSDAMWSIGVEINVWFFSFELFFELLFFDARNLNIDLLFFSLPHLNFYGAYLNSHFILLSFCSPSSFLHIFCFRYTRLFFFPFLRFTPSDLRDTSTTFPSLLDVTDKWRPLFLIAYDLIFYCVPAVCLSTPHTRTHTSRCRGPASGGPDAGVSWNYYTQ